MASGALPLPIPDGEERSVFLPGFAFHVGFAAAGGGAFAPFDGLDEPMTGGFSEVSGLETTMEAKAIKEGGRNYGPHQRAGTVSFATVILKRGIVESRHLWRWWSLFAGGDGSENGGWAPASRCDVSISLIRGRFPVVGWRLENAMPTKFRIGDLNARGTEVAIEEIHLVHEGLHMVEVG